MRDTILQIVAVVVALTLALAVLALTTFGPEIRCAANRAAEEQGLGTPFARQWPPVDTRTLSILSPIDGAEVGRRFACRVSGLTDVEDGDVLRCYPISDIAGILGEATLAAGTTSATIECSAPDVFLDDVVVSWWSSKGEVTHGMAAQVRCR